MKRPSLGTECARPVHEEHDRYHLAMKAYVAITDGDWFEAVRYTPQLDELNAWKPTGSRHFRALDPGEPYLFKLHSPNHYIVGGAFFVHSSNLPSSAAWEAFGRRNGCHSLGEMNQRVDHYARGAKTGEPTIGCILLHSPFFFDRLDWIPAPDDFHPSIVQGKLYDLAEEAGERIWTDVRERLDASSPVMTKVQQGSLFGDSFLLQRRLGRGTFRVLILDSYSRTCAATGCDILPSLDVALIKPLSSGGLRRIDNGILIRADLKRLFEVGYLSVDSESRWIVSSQLAREFEVRGDVQALHGRPLKLPNNPDHHPRAGFLEWHRAKVFRR